MNKTITVCTAAIKDFDALFRKLGKIADRFELTPAPEYRVVTNSKREVHERRVSIAKLDGDEYRSEDVYLVEVVDVELTLPDAVQADGWRLVGILDRVEDGLESTGNGAADLAILATFRDANTQTCAHCQTRRIRNRLTILQKGEEIIQVGRECAHNYLTDAAQAIGDLEFQALIVSEFKEGSGEPWGSGGGGSLQAYDVGLALDEIVTCVRARGFTPSRSKPRYDDGSQGEPNFHATWRLVENELINTSCKVIKQSTRAYPVPTDLDVLVSTELADWIISVPVADNEFLAQLQDIARAGFISRRKLGILAALPSAFSKWQEKQAELALGEPTELAPEGRCEVSGTIVSVKTGENDFGPFCKLLIRLEDLNKVWVSCPSALDPEKGAKVRLVATFTRSEKDVHFSYGKRPTIPKPPKAKKPRAQKVGAL